MITIEQEVYRLLDQYEFPIDLIKHSIVPFLDRAFLIVGTLCVNDSNRIRPFLDQIVQYADGLCISEYRSSDDTVSAILQWYKEYVDTTNPSFPFSFEYRKSFVGFKQSNHDLIEQATQSAHKFNLPLDHTFLCFLYPNEQLVYSNLRLLRQDLIQRNDCHYLVQQDTPLRSGYKLGLIRLAQVDTLPETDIDQWSNYIQLTNYTSRVDNNGNTFPIAPQLKIEQIKLIVDPCTSVFDLFK